tara:strand:+ start:28360 stop:28641 length:282 start_codon:yes stop_codon:yes gene_type:complete
MFGSVFQTTITARKATDKKHTIKSQKSHGVEHEKISRRKQSAMEAHILRLRKSSAPLHKTSPKPITWIRSIPVPEAAKVSTIQGDASTDVDSV